jgi:4-amino-4-deoxy-L-arabinose transferase-like glycosyltransferase
MQNNCPDPDLCQLIRKSWLYFALITALGGAFRALFILRSVLPFDGLVYGEMARNWLQHGVLGLSGTTGLTPSLIRLPGYPAFLAAIWSITGVEHYTAVLIVQALVDVAACYLAADLTLRTTRSPRAARIAFLLAVLCPFTANYTACVLTETLSIFFTALALDCAVLAADSTRIKHWAACGVAVTAGMLLRPDGGMMLAIVLAFVLLRAASSVAGKQPLTDLKRRLLPSVVICAVVLAAFVPWTVRNWRDFHVFQPLAPRYANSPNEFVPLGFQRWVKTWMADYTSVAEIYWSQGEGPLEIEKMPDRAFDSTFHLPSKKYQNILFSLL